MHGLWEAGIPNPSSYLSTKLQPYLATLIAPEKLNSGYIDQVTWRNFTT